MKTVKLIVILAATATLANFAFADGGHVGGGNIKETDIKYMMTRLDTYLYSSEGKATFPEIAKYDELNPGETIHDIIRKTNPVVADGVVRDDFNIERDCVSNFEDKNNRYFTCNGNALPDYTLDNQPRLYRFVFHEILVQAKIESPLGIQVPSVYPVSSRLNLHLETYQEWAPGEQSILATKLRCVVAFRDMVSMEQ